MDLEPLGLKETRDLVQEMMVFFLSGMTVHSGSTVHY